MLRDDFWVLMHFLLIYLDQTFLSNGAIDNNLNNFYRTILFLWSMHLYFFIFFSPFHWKWSKKYKASPSHTHLISDKHKQLRLFLTLIHSTSSPPRALTGTSFTCLCLPAMTMMSCSSAMYSKLTIFLPSPMRAISVESNDVSEWDVNYLMVP